MYGDNQRIIMLGGGIVLAAAFLSLPVISLVKVNRLEKYLNPESRETRTSRELTSEEEKNTTAPGTSGEIQEGETANREMAFYDALEYWDGVREEREKFREETAELDEEEWDFLGDLDLTREAVSQSGSWSILNGDSFPVLTVEYKEGTWQFTAYSGEVSTHRSLNNKARQYIADQALLAREEQAFLKASAALFDNLSRNGDLLFLLGEKECRLEIIREEEIVTALEIVTREEERPLISLRYTGQGRYINDRKAAGDPDSFIREVLDELRSADTRPAREIAHSQALELIRSMYGDKAFAASLEQRGLYPDWNLREDEDFSYIDLKDGDGVFKGAFAVKKLSGRIYLTDENEVPLVSLDSLEQGQTEYPRPEVAALPENLEQIEGIYDSRGSYTVLLVGYHNGGTDTMILAHVDKTSEQITLMSVPRDLWWENRKINAYYFGESRDRLLEVLSQITGIRVDYYLSVDMYAFIDVVNAMGGVDITLDQAVIDPSYRVIREDGTEGTLYYPPGSYHLNGVEALRLARSRHGSSDFDRGALQREILLSMKDRLGDLSLSDAGLFRDFLSIALDHSETNMSLPFMVASLLGAGDYHIQSAPSLFEEGVIYSTYSNYLGLSGNDLARARDKEEFNRGQWILLPVGDDWNMVRYKVREILGVGNP